MFVLRFLLRFYNYYFADERGLAHHVKELTGFVPARLSLFARAFSHKSGAGQRQGVLQTNNERLEYLGDAVLGTIVAEYLFKKYPSADEGFLTKMRSKIVKRKSLNSIGEEMGLSVVLQERNRMRLSSSMLGNAVEALVGAVYLERGYARTERFVIRRMLRPYIDVGALEATDDNYKSQLLEACQKRGQAIGYKLVRKFKHDRRDRFEVAVMVDGQQVSIADDFNKKSAEQLASLKALEQMGLADNLTVPRRKERKSRSGKRTGKRGGREAAPSRAAIQAAAPLATVGPTTEEPAPRTPAPPTAKRPAKRRRSPYDYLVKHAVKTGVAGGAALAFALDGARPVGSRVPVGERNVDLRGILTAGSAGIVAAERAFAPTAAPTAAPPPVPPPRKTLRPKVRPVIRHAALTAIAGVAIDATAPE